MVRITLDLGSRAWRPFLPTPSASLASHGPAGTLGLEEGQAPPETLLQELHVGGCRWVFEGGREAEDLFHVLRLHGGDVQEVVGVDMLDLREGLAEEGRPRAQPGRPLSSASSLLRLTGEKQSLSGLDYPALRRMANGQDSLSPSQHLPGARLDPSCLFSH